MAVVYRHGPSGETFYGSHGLVEHLEENVFNDTDEATAKQGVDDAVKYLGEVEVSDDADDTEETSEEEKPDVSPKTRK